MEIKYRDVGVVLDQDDFDCIVEMAGYGIHYWCPKAIVDDDTYEVFWFVDEDGEIAEWSEQTTSKVLTKQDIADGIAKIIADVDHAGWFVARALSTGGAGEVDSAVADRLIQTCLWGTTIFG